MGNKQCEQYKGVKVKVINEFEKKAIENNLNIKIINIYNLDTYGEDVQYSIEFEFEETILYAWGNNWLKSEKIIALVIKSLEYEISLYKKIRKETFSKNYAGHVLSALNIKGHMYNYTLYDEIKELQEATGVMIEVIWAQMKKYEKQSGIRDFKRVYDYTMNIFDEGFFKEGLMQIKQKYKVEKR